MTKADFIESLAEKTGKSKAEAERLVDAFDEVVVEGLRKDGEVRIGNLGKIHVVYRAPRAGVNPKDPTKTYDKAESATATFRLSGNLKGIVNTPAMIAMVKPKD